MHQTFKEWNEGELNSYLIEITADILKFKEEDGSYLVDNILDTAGQKGTGKWTASVALDLGSPLTLIGEAVFSRYLSSIKEERVEASSQLSGPRVSFSGDKAQALKIFMMLCMPQKWFHMLRAIRSFQMQLKRSIGI